MLIASGSLGIMTLNEFWDPQKHWYLYLCCSFVFQARLGMDLLSLRCLNGEESFIV